MATCCNFNLPALQDFPCKTEERMFVDIPAGATYDYPDIVFVDKWGYTRRYTTRLHENESKAREIFDNVKRIGSGQGVRLLLK